MRVTIIKKEKLVSFLLPKKVSGNLWLYDFDENGIKQNIINVEALNGKWVFKNNFDVKVANSIEDATILEEYSFYQLEINNEEKKLVVYCSPVIDNSFINLKIQSENVEIPIGGTDQSGISINLNYFKEKRAKLKCTSGKWQIIDINSASSIYVNNQNARNKTLEFGDVIFIMGIKIIVLPNAILINNPKNIVSYNNALLMLNEFNNNSLSNLVENENDLVNDTINYFYRSPRFKTSIEKEKVVIDTPPQKEQTQQMPMIYTMGPMITMGMTSLITAFSSVNNIVNNGKSITSALPTIIIAVAMLMTMILWPLLTKNYDKKQKKKKEEKRQKKYTEYIEKKRKELYLTSKKQQQILIENNVPLSDCYNIIANKRRNLWEREIGQDDFLNVCVGKGTLPMEIEIAEPDNQFVMEEDNLKEMRNSLINEFQELSNVPITMSFIKNNISAVVGEKEIIKQFFDGILLQILTFHSYDELKIVFFTEQQSEEKWEYLKKVPHCFDDLKNIRFFATDIEEMNQLSLYLEKILQSRKSRESSLFKPHYLIITDNLKQARDIEIIKDVLKSGKDTGFSLIILNDKLSNLPSECNVFINVGAHNSGIFESDLVSDKQKEFEAQFLTDIDMNTCSKILANIPIEIENVDGKLPEMISFLEMYDVGNVEQLNIANRWHMSDPISSLKAPIGVNKNNEVINLDLHEKFHGPHGLIAGMTGSGKSEFIITYILSLAVNYSPDEVSFVLIDYKGGGLAGVFENRETGIKLPHLAGTITNLDTAEMNRSLVSIQSELKRRQKLFNEARIATEESTIDIYKYQKMFRTGQVKTPIPHLFIICDEFAELKTQQPDFMDQLISTARIGRSLGVHLILATQKPSGIVNDQIWSNSRFRVCLKVQEKSDSMDMLKCDDAALLTTTGRFYLQVGYNELFILGQSAWCGAQYTPVDKRKKKIDKNVNIIDNVGNIIKSASDNLKEEKNIIVGEEVTNILTNIIETSKRENIISNKLWLDKLPSVIYLNELEKKYNFNSKPYVINPIIGEYDDPANQYQNILNINLSECKNIILYGTTGSGKENLLSTMIYSTIKDHNVDEINFYILDFGTEMLKNFIDAPQVGDIILSNENEKIDNVFKLLKDTINERKKQFAEYNTDFNSYKEKSGKDVPLITVIINNYEGFNESYEQYDDMLTLLSREGNKYGIIFILTSNTTNGIRYKLKHNFEKEIFLQLSSEEEYYEIVGSSKELYPASIPGRGLIKLDNVYEFQTAYISNPEEVNEKIKEFSTVLKDNSKTLAPTVPVLPEIVTQDILNKYINGSFSLPIGIEKSSLDIAYYDFSPKKINMISSQDINDTVTFTNSLIDELKLVKNNRCIVLDSESLLANNISNVQYYNSNLVGVLNSVNQLVNSVYETYKKNNYNIESLKAINNFTIIFFGINSIYKKLDDNLKSSLNNLFEKAFETKKFSFIMIDSVDNFKKMEFDNWYRNNIDGSDAIWIGNGIADQFTVKLSSITGNLREEIGNNFGFSVKRGKPTLIKIVGESDKNE